MGGCIAKTKGKPRFSRIDLLDLSPKENYLVLVPASDTLPGAAVDYTIKGQLSTTRQRACEDKVTIKDDRETWFGIGHACRKGLKSEEFNQDDFCITRKGETLLLSVFDGHGQDGHQISALVRERLPQLILDDVDSGNLGQHIRNAFDQVHKEVVESDVGFNSDMSGTTASVVVITGNTLFAAHVGDSRAVVARRVQGGYDAEVLTPDHKPSQQKEKDRIESCGGEVKRLPGDFPHRVFLPGSNAPGLALSRAIGDGLAHSVGVTHIPEVTSLTLGSEHSFVLLCSDGVWEFITSHDAVNLVGSFGKNNPQEAAEALAAEAWRKWVAEEQHTVDDITVVLAYLR